MVNRDKLARDFLNGEANIVISTVEGNFKYREYELNSILFKDNYGKCECTLHLKRYGEENSRGKFFSIYITEDSSKNLYSDTMYGIKSVLSRVKRLKGSIIDVEIAFYRLGKSKASIVERTKFTKIIPYK